MQLSGVQLIAALSPWAVLPVNLIYDASIKTSPLSAGNRGNQRRVDSIGKRVLIQNKAWWCEAVVTRVLEMGPRSSLDPDLCLHLSSRIYKASLIFKGMRV